MKNLLWIDGGGAGIVGLAMLALVGPLGRLYALPPDLLRLMALVSLVYASYSLTLASRPRRPRWSILLLVAANLAWAIVCLVFAKVFMGSASVFGLGHLGVEAVYVGGLACLEWRWRNQLLQP